MEYACVTDIGLVREMNQDSYLALENEYGDLLVLVADGIGGGKAGEVASGEVIKYFDFIFKESGPFESLDDGKRFIEYHVEIANSIIYDLSNKYDNYSGMGTTITGILITKQGILSINCGDSRVYGFIDNMVLHLTKDDTLVNQMLEKGQISYEESLNHPKKHYLVKAIGIFNTCEVDINKVRDMDYYLVCSDGLHAYLDDEEIGNIVFNKKLSLQEKVEELKDSALMKGGYDNITVVLFEK